VCAGCPLRAQCIASKAGGGKIIQLHPREDLLQQARTAAKTEAFKELYHRRVAVEHSIARLVQRGIRKSRYFSRKRTLWQVALAAAVVNLIVIAGKGNAKDEQQSSFLFLFWWWHLILIKNLTIRYWPRVTPIDFVCVLNRRPPKIITQRTVAFRPSF
jgi:hypothetical protein